MVKTFAYIDQSGIGVGPYVPAHATVDAVGALITTANPQHVADVMNAPFSGVIPMTAGTSYPVQRAVGVDCLNPGRLTFTLFNGSSISLPIAVGWQIFPFACSLYTVPGTGGANAIVYNLV